MLVKLPLKSNTTVLTRLRFELSDLTTVCGRQGRKVPARASVLVSVPFCDSLLLALAALGLMAYVFVFADLCSLMHLGASLADEVKSQLPPR
jgi:hypothetical protein